MSPKGTELPKARQVELPRSLTVKQLADLLELSPVEVIKQLMRNGIMVSINQAIDYEAAALVATGLGYEPREAAPTPAVAARAPSLEDSGPQQPRPPVVTVMGHVDHGKTKLLDAIRQTNVTASEVGGITQHIGAYQVEVDGGRVTFIDTPGHEAFTAMRARGAQATDIAVLVVAADDGVMPQTIEAIDHARAAKVPIVVAINKIDKPDANPERVKQQLAEQGLLLEEWGGDVICVPVSAKTKQGIPELLANILLVAEMAELKANPQRPAQGVVIEAKLDKTRGPLATVLVQTGTIKVVDYVVVGEVWGRVKALFNDKGKRVKQAGPATPVEVLGLNSAPQAGDAFAVVSNEKQARALAQERREHRERQALAPGRLLSLASLSSQVSQGRIKELNIILKTDVQGSIEPIRSSLERLEADGAKVRVIRSGTGSITESDVLLAVASKGLIVGFNTTAEPGARRLAETEGVDIRHYQVIYELVDDVERALKGMVEPSYVDIIEGRAEVKAIFPTGKKGRVAGGFILEGKVTLGARARILRNGQPVYDSRVYSLRRYKDNVTEVPAGTEAGVGIEGYNDFEAGDIIEVYRREKAS